MRPTWRAALAYSAFFAAVGVGFPYLPVYYRSLGLDLATIGLVSALGSGVQLVGAPAWGALADRFPRSRLTLVLAALLAAAASVGLAAAAGTGAILAAAALLAFGLAGIGPVLDARALELLGPDRVRFGQLRAWGSLAFVASAIAVGGLVDANGIRALFVAYAPCLVATAVIGAWLPRTGATRTPSILRGAAGLVRSRELIAFLGAALLVFTALNGVTWFYSIALSELGGSGTEVGLVWAVGALVEVPIMFAYPRIAGRFGRRRMLVVGSFLFAVRALLSATAVEPWQLIAISPIEGIAYGLFWTGGVDYVAHRAPAGLAATAQGLYASTGWLAAIVAAAVGGVVAQASSIAALFAFCGAAGIVGCAVVALATRSDEALPASGSAVP